MIRSYHITQNGFRNASNNVSPSRPFKMLRIPGPNAPPAVKPSLQAGSKSTGSLDMLKLRGMNGQMPKQKEVQAPHLSPPIPTNPQPARLAWAQRILKKKWHRFESYWAENSPQQYRDLAIKIDKRPHELCLPRTTLGRLLAALTGHGDWEQYHERFRHGDAKINRSCGRPKSPHHFYYC